MRRWPLNPLAEKFIYKSCVKEDEVIEEPQKEEEWI